MSIVWTYSCWIKRSLLGTVQILLNAAAGSEIGFTAADKIRFTTATGDLLTTAILRDCSGWYHIVVATDTSQATASDRVNIYINGLKITDYDTETYMDQNEVTDFLELAPHTLGANESDTEEFDGYMAEFVLIDGTQYNASDFGENQQGIWIPKEVSGLEFGTTGTWLDFENSADLGNDNSENANDWTETNFGEDHQVTDTPEDNYATLDWNNKRSLAALRESGLRPISGVASWYLTGSTFLLKTGKWYWEMDIGSSNNVDTGVVAMDHHSGDLIKINYYTGQPAFGYSIMARRGAAPPRFSISNNAVLTDDVNLPEPASNDILQVAYDAETGEIWFGVNNTWGDWGSGVGDPANGINPAYTVPDVELYDMVPAAGAYINNDSMVNFGQRTFAYTPPTGFSAVSTSNLAEPDFIEPTSEQSNVIIYEGTGAENSLTGVGFQPDLVWIKNRDAGDSHMIFDSVRGVNLFWESDSPDIEGDDAQSLKSFDPSGFTVGTNVAVNTNNEKYVAFCLKKGAEYGFDIQTYEGTGVAHAESHDLGAVPELMIVKNRDFARGGRVYHHYALTKADPETDFAYLDTYAAFADDVSVWNDTAPTSTHFTVGTSNGTNRNNDNLVAYLWRSIPGYSKAFVYKGNGNINGPYVYCGFKPRWVLIKCRSSNGSWWLIDTERSKHNPIAQLSQAEEPDDELTGSLYYINAFSNGLKITNTTGGTNGNGQFVVGIAFAEQSFKYNNAR